MWPRHTARPNSKQWVLLQKQLVPKGRSYAGEGDYQSLSVSTSEKNYPKILDEDLILELQEESEGPNAPFELQEVERITVIAYPVNRLDEAAILCCERLRLCNLNGCYIEDIRAFYGSVNLLKLDVSDNQVSAS